MSLIAKFEKRARQAKTIPNVTRAQFQPQAPLGGFRVAARRFDIAPAIGTHTTGYGPLSKVYSRGVFGHHHALVIVMGDDQGERAAIIALDLHAGTRWITEQVAARTGFGLGRVLVTATHCHLGPGNLYGDRFYDHTGSRIAGFDRVYADWLRDRLVDVVGSLNEGLANEPRATVSFGQSMAWDLLWHRSLEAWLENLPYIQGLRNPGSGNTQSLTRTKKLLRDPDHRDQIIYEARKLATHINGEVPPALANLPLPMPKRKERDEALERSVVDARVRALVFRQAENGQPIAALGFCAATPTLVPKRSYILNTDTFGEASRQAMRRMHDTFEFPIPVALVGSAHGDTNVVPPTTDGTIDALIEDFEGRDTHASRVQHLARRGLRVGQRLGDVLFQAIQSAVSAPFVAEPPLTISPGYFEEVIPHAPVKEQGVARNLPRQPLIGRSTLAASDFDHTGLAKEGERIGPVDLDAPHSPKIAAGMAGLQALVTNATVLDQTPFFGVATLRIGDIRILGIPAEPSVGWGHDVESRIKALEGDHLQVIPAGLAGGYVGYINTRDEYLAQAYEGSSQFWGRNFGTWVAELCERLVQASTSVPQQRWSEGLFTSIPVRKNGPSVADLERIAGVLSPDETKRVPFRFSIGPVRRMKGWHSIQGEWSTEEDTDAVLERRLADATPVLCLLERRPDGTLVELTWGGRPVDDRSAGIVLYRDVVRGENFARWTFEFSFDDELRKAWKGRKLTFAVRRPEVAPFCGSGSQWVKTAWGWTWHEARLIPEPANG